MLLKKFLPNHLSLLHIGRSDEYEKHSFDSMENKQG